MVMKLCRPQSSLIRGHVPHGGLEPRPASQTPLLGPETPSPGSWELLWLLI